MVKKWTDYLPGAVYARLCDCRTEREDLPALVNAKWYAMKLAGKDKEGFTKEDALVYILDLMDCNSRYFDLSRDEYDELLRD